jgi:two-component system cell cycle response regulator DivK
MKKILLVEDNPRNALLIERVLERLPYQLFLAPDGETGLEIAETETLDLLLVDMGLPDIDGQTLVNLLRNIPALQDKPIVAITAWPPDVAIEMAQRYGCNGCITKPIDIRAFPDQIAEYLNPQL